MSMMDRIRGRLGWGDTAPGRDHAAVGAEDLRRLGLGALADVGASAAPSVERRRAQQVGPQDGHVVMRRRAGDWAHETEAGRDERQQERRAG